MLFESGEKGHFGIFFFYPTCILKLAFGLAATRLVSVFLVINFVLYFNILVCAKGFKGSVLTNSSRGIQHAWHFWYALVFVLKCHAVTSVLRASPLNWALVANEKNGAKTKCLGLRS
ncbi:hypothetical protein, partial [Vibrio parahaemolyticus]|uniref:hypothetical protein n=1 Tax=Vibrio parahaemolyticus TaxID=670 RepID=UPI00356B627D